ncbi:hypothetical protein DITRI_Ditri04bG0147800 [Diplodiscus trichospermus]
MLASTKEQLQAAATLKVELGLSGLALDMHPITKIKPSSKKKRKFSDEQIKLLEFMFESDSRPESPIKQQLANELGLHPRQIAIWFQNRRARSKTKQIERDYNILKESCDALASSYESLKRENQSLRCQLQRLTSQLEIEHENKTYGPNGTAGNGADGKFESRSAIFDAKEKTTFQFDGYDSLPSCENNSRNVESRDEDRVVLRMMEATDRSLTSSDLWCSLDDSSRTSNWWELW